MVQREGTQGAQGALVSASSGLGDPKPSKGSARRARRKKNAGVKDKNYLSWLHEQPCLVRGCLAPVEAHHERAISRDDAMAVPLCTAHHRGPQGRHGLRSINLFQDAYGISLLARALELRGRFKSEHPK